MQQETRPQYIPLQAVSTERIPSRQESTETLLTTEHAGTRTSHPTQPSQKPTLLHPSMWMWEVISLLFAILIFLAVLSILAAYDGKPSPVVGGITLNTVVAFAATLFRICLMVPVTGCICQLTWVWLSKDYKPLQDVARFDAASRGPLGSLLILSELRSNHVLSLAGIVVIIGIAIGPFFQQSVTFHGASTESRDPTQSAFLSAAFTYAGTVGYVGDSHAAYGNDIPFNLKSAMYTGLYSSSMITLPQPPYSCPTGNCTWDPFPTLGVSVQCFDDTKNYFLNCTGPGSNPWPGRELNPCTMEYRNSSSEFPWYPSKVFRSIGDWRDTAPSDYNVFTGLSHFDYGFTEPPQDTWTSINAGFAAFRWSLARNLLVFPAELARPSIITSQSIIEAGNCIFYPNMQVISARVQNGIYEEHVINSTMRIQPYYNRVPTTLPGGYPLYQIGPDQTDNVTYTYYPTCQSPSKRCGAEFDPQPVNVTIPRQRYTNLVAAIRNVLPTAYVSTQRQSGLSSNGSTNPVAAEMLCRSPNITSTMHTLAHYISVALRANDTILERQNDPNNATGLPADYVAPSHRVVGTVYVQTVLLHARWGWLAFPAALVLIVAGVLFETIRTSRHESIGVWKDNPLALLLNTQWRPESGMVGAGTSAELKDIAKGLEVSVVRGDGAEVAHRTVIIRERSSK